MNPLISATVVIPTKNRKEILCETLASLLRQSVALEILVLDDGSTDGTADEVRQKFPGVRLLRDEQSRGPTVQRNRGAALATSAILLTIDDDVTMPSPHTVAQTLEAFDHPRVGAVTIPFINILQSPKTLSAAPSKDKIYAAYDFYGGMVAFRREAFLQVGGYEALYFMHVEEPDLSIRLLDAGYVVRLGVADALQHHESPIRNLRRLHELGPRNHVLYAWQHVPTPHLAAHLLGTTVLCLRHTIKIGHPWLGMRGILRGYAACLREWRKRRPVSREVYRLSRELKKRGAVPLDEIEARLPPLRNVAGQESDNFHG